MEQVLVTRGFADRRVQRFLLGEQVPGQAWCQTDRRLAVWGTCSAENLGSTPLGVQPPLILRSPHMLGLGRWPVGPDRVEG